MNIPKFSDRMKVTNDGETIFEQYCKEKGYRVDRIGFDEHSSEIPNFWLLNHLIRNLPDYVVQTNHGPYIVQVKGTDNFKKKELDLLPLFLDWYHSPKAPLVYAFCFKGSEPILKYPDQIIRLYEKSVDQKWDDGVIYRCLKIKPVQNHGELNVKQENF